MTEERLGEIEERLNECSASSRSYDESAWEVSNELDGWLVAALGSGSDGQPYYVQTSGVHASELRGSAEEDAAFIANAPKDIRDLLAEVRRLQVLVVDR